MLITLLLICKGGLLRVADPSFVEACQQHIISRYYNCDIDVANDTEIINNRTWLTCPTYIGIIRVLNTLYNYKKYNKIDRCLWVYCSLADYHIQYLEIQEPATALVLKYLKYSFKL